MESMPITPWSNFFADFAHYAKIAIRDKPVATPLEHYSSFFTHFTELYSEHMSQELGVNFPQLAGIGNDELRIGIRMESMSITPWSNFFADFDRYAKIAIRDKPIAIPLEHYSSFFTHFTGLYSEHMSQGLGVNFIELVGIGNDELRNCKLLAWLLDCFGSHGQGTAFLQCLFENIHCSNTPKNFPTLLDISQGYQTLIESSYDEEESENKRSRVDIELEGNGFLLFMEAKIFAKEGKKQLLRYVRIGNARAGKRPWGLLFITRTGCPPEQNDLRDKVVCISWRTIGESFLHYAQTMPKTHGSIVIQQICQHFIKL